jgi:hypothetical protein
MNKMRVDSEHAAKMLAVSVEEDVRQGVSIEDSVAQAGRKFGVEPLTVQKLLLPKVVGMSIHEKCSQGIGIEDAVIQSLRRFNVEASKEQILQIVKAHHAEQERINTRLASHEFDDGMGGTGVIVDVSGNPIAKSALSNPKN